jgi:hypothetical protein
MRPADSTVWIVKSRQKLSRRVFRDRRTLNSEALSAGPGGSADTRRAVSNAANGGIDRREVERANLFDRKRTLHTIGIAQRC